jgi:hypothetical protein
MKRTFTSVISQTITESKRVIYLVLKQKPLPQQILDNVREEAEKRFEIFIKEKLSILNSVKPDDPENFIKCFMLRGIILILDQMYQERHIKLSQKDKETIKQLFENGHIINNEKETKFNLPMQEENFNEKKYYYYPLDK